MRTHRCYQSEKKANPGLRAHRFGGVCVWGGGRIKDTENPPIRKKDRISRPRSRKVYVYHSRHLNSRRKRPETRRENNRDPRIQFATSGGSGSGPLPPRSPPMIYRPREIERCAYTPPIRMGGSHAVDLSTRGLPLSNDLTERRRTLFLRATSSIPSKRSRACEFRSPRYSNRCDSFNEI